MPEHDIHRPGADDARRYAWLFITNLRNPRHHWELGVEPGPAGRVWCWTNQHPSAVPIPDDLARSLAAFVASLDDHPASDGPQDV